MKVFCTGLQRTGTSSLAAALRLLGLKTLDFPVELFRDLDHDVIRHFDAFTDNPIPALYRELDARHPGAKFVHTTRDEESWIESVRWLFTVGAVKFSWDRHPVIHEVHRQLYGTSEFDEPAFREAFRRHNADVAAYFEGRPGDLLCLDMAGGAGFDALCPFLGLKDPAVPFPHRNKREGRFRVAFGAWPRRIFKRRRDR